MISGPASVTRQVGERRREHPPHGRVLREHLGDDLGDPAGLPERHDLAHQAGADPVALPVVHDLDGEVGPTGADGDQPGDADGLPADERAERQVPAAVDRGQPLARRGGHPGHGAVEAAETAQGRQAREHGVEHRAVVGAQLAHRQRGGGQHLGVLSRGGHQRRARTAPRSSVLIAHLGIRAGQRLGGGPPRHALPPAATRSA